MASIVKLEQRSPPLPHPSGQVLDTVLLPEKNPGVPAVGWFTTRLSPVGAAGPIAIDAPCEM